MKPISTTATFRVRWTLLVLPGALIAAMGMAASPYARWDNGPSTNSNYFPIAVWLQNPSNADRYRAAGINLYVGLWHGPTAEQLEALRNAGISVICHQNSTALSEPGNPTIVGWMHDDEPDNAQSLGERRGYGPPVDPSVVVADYRKWKASDGTRPVLLNMGQGVAWDNYIGRGVRRNRPEDYPKYIQGADILSFDIYPAVHTDPEVAGKLEYVARGVERLVAWAEPDQIVWNCVECTRISNTEVKPTPAQVRAEVWMSLIHGSRGLIYFVHQFQPVFREAALFDDPDMLEAVTRINQQIHQLAPALNSPSIADVVELEVVPSDVPIATMVKRQGDAIWLFAVSMRSRASEVRFGVRLLKAPTAVAVLGEGRTIPVLGGAFNDRFGPYEVHLYRLE